MALQKTLLATAIVCAMASGPALAQTDAQELEQLKRQLGDSFCASPIRS